MPEKRPAKRYLNDIALQQMKRLHSDPNVTFVGLRTDASVTIGEEDEKEGAQLIVWIARHSVLPGQPQPRALSLIDADAPLEAIVDTFVDAVLPEENKNLAPILPGHVEVADEATVKLLRTALAPLKIEVALANDLGLLDTIARRLLNDVQRHLVPMPLWDAPVETMRDLYAAAANFYRREPWTVLHDIPPVTVEINRYGIDTLYLMVLFDLDSEGNRGIIAYRSLEAYQRAGRVSFAMAQFEDAEGDLQNLDMPQSEIALVEQTLERPESAMSNAFTLFFVSSDEIGEDALKELQAARISFASRDAVPTLMQIGPEGDIRRPNNDECQALRLAIEAFNLYYVRHQQQLLQEDWHFAPIEATVTPKLGTQRVPVKVSVASGIPTFDKRLQDRVLRLRVFPEDDITVWREIEVLAQQSTDSLDTVIRSAFEWPDERETLFMPKDVNDGDVTYEIMTERDYLSSPRTPIGLLVSEPRDFCHYIYDVEGVSIDMLVRVRSVGEKEDDMVYPRLVASHGEAPEPIEMFDLDDDDEDFDDEDDLDDEDDDE